MWTLRFDGERVLIFDYERLRAVIEDGAAPLDPGLYECKDEPGKYKSPTRTLVFR